MLRLVASFERSVCQWSYPEKEVRLGAAPDNDLVLEFPPAAGVSRYHASLRPSERGLLVADLGSKNGLWQAGRQVDAAVLRPGQAVRLGKVRLEVEEISTSEVDVALAARRPRGSRGTESATDTEIELDSASGDERLRIVRFVADLTALGSEERAARRLELLADAHPLLGCACLALVSLAGTDEIAWLAVAGELPSAAESAGLAAAAVERGQRAWLLAEQRGPAGEVLAARFSARRALPWQRWFLELLANHLLTGSPTRRGRREASPVEPPQGFVRGSSTAMAEVLRRIEQVAPLTGDVLLVGETGTGKELCARMIHSASPRRAGPFVPMNCGAIPESMVEAELFGVKPGAATGVEQRKGVFASANGGTVFLDEVSELTPAAQTKLLRVLEEREVVAVGSDSPQKLDVRVIAATNADLDTRRRQGRFRDDLLYRLWVFVLRLPPLRERPEDIPQLALAFLTEASAESGKTLAGLSAKALALLLAHSWEGNVRELRNAVRAAVAACRDGGVVESGHFDLLRAASGPAEAPAPSAAPPERNLRRAEADAARQAVIEALARTGGNVTQAAKLLDMTRNGLAAKMRRLGIARPK